MALSVCPYVSFEYPSDSVCRRIQRTNTAFYRECQSNARIPIIDSLSICLERPLLESLFYFGTRSIRDWTERLENRETMIEMICRVSRTMNGFTLR